MVKRIILTSTLALFCGCLGLDSLAQGNPAAGKTTQGIDVTANKFLALLDDGQRAKVVFSFKDEAQRKRWSNLPSGIFRRAGLRMVDLTPPQRKAALAVLAAALSPQGYEKVLQIVEGDELLRKGEGGRVIFGRDEYFVSFLGQPAANEPWMIQFGGHHLGLNITLVGGQGTLAPSHTGAQPAIYELEGKTVRPLGRETDKAFALMSSMDEAQRKQAILGFEMRDLVLSPNEAAAYAELLKRDLIVRVDQHRVELKLTASNIGELTELRTGFGIIQMEFSGAPGRLAAGLHQLAFENRHLPADSVHRGLAPPDSDRLAPQQLSHPPLFLRRLARPIRKTD